MTDHVFNTPSFKLWDLLCDLTLWIVSSLQTKENKNPQTDKAELLASVCCCFPVSFLLVGIADGQRVREIKSDSNSVAEILSLELPLDKEVNEVQHTGPDGQTLFLNNGKGKR